MRIPLTPFLLALLPLAASAQQSGLEIGAMDPAVSPCTNFYQYACGGWRANNPIPADKATWGRFNALAEHNLDTERQILEKSAMSSPGRSALDQQIGDYYAACMDEPSIEKKGVAPLTAEFESIRVLAEKQKLAAEVARLQKAGAGVLFRFGADADRKNASMNIADIDQGGLSLPDRDYYLKMDQRSVDLRAQYLKHVTNMFDLLAKAENTTWDSQAKAKAVLDIETQLAKLSLDRVARRDPDNTYHPMTMKDLPALTPSFEWTRYFAEEGAPSFDKLNVGVPEFFKGLDQVITATSLDDMKAYLTWHVVHGAVNVLPAAFVNENFEFYGKVLTGSEALEPRWKRCVRSVDRGLGEALGKKFVEVAFSGPAKPKALELVHEIEKAMEQDIRTAAWMTDATKQQALAKLNLVSNKIGYPDKFRDYSSIEIKRDDFAGDARRAREFELRRDLAKIGKPVDKSEWGMTPPTVNAYYNPPENNINFPAGILQPPFYSAKAADAVNYGAIGVVVGHELSHGFDDQGRRFDGAGNLRDWWSKDDAKNFTDKAQCIVDEYGAFSPVDGVKLNGKLTLGENAADNGGIHLAYAALMDRLANSTIPKMDGFTPQQLFFLGYAQIWCQNVRDAQSRQAAVTDLHSPGQFRVNGVVQNLKEFQTAFSCKAGDPMVSEKSCRVW